MRKDSRPLCSTLYFPREALQDIRKSRVPQNGSCPCFFIRLPTYIAYHLGHAVGVFLLISDGSKQTSN